MARKRLGTPVSYPAEHPYHDPRKRTADAVGMLDAMAPRYTVPEWSSAALEHRVREFVGFMWAVEGRNLSNPEIARYRLGLLMEKDRRQRRG